jgi:hypothetical protein
MALGITDGRGLFLIFLERFDFEELVKALTVARMIWHRRNEFVFQGVFNPPAQVMVVALVSLHGFTNATMDEGPNQRAASAIPHLWHKPPTGSWKINWDAAISKEMKKMGVGVVIWDVDGRVVAAQTKVVPYITDPLAAESLATWYAVLLGIDRG